MANIIEITNLQAPELDVFARLTEAQLRNKLEPEKGLFIAESPKVIDRALDAGYNHEFPSGARRPVRSAAWQQCTHPPHKGR